ncbi:uncharacterized protein [Nicotiana tomentosiformis]|uniref:uncharacterized protein n=1 Tax=Nicotiana tomentosiformis TaxID=4098 RepID=UPI00388CCC01
MPWFSPMPWFSSRGVSHPLTEEQVKGMLKKYDKNGDGKLSKQELRLAFKEMGLHFCRWKAGKALRFADRNGDGYINDDEISEFVQYASKWDIARSVEYSELAKDIWSELEERYGQADAARVFELKKTLAHISQGSLDIASYFNKIKQLWDEIDALFISRVRSCNNCGFKSDYQKDDDVQKSILLSHEKQRQVSTYPQFFPTSTSFNAEVSKQGFPFKVNFDGKKPLTCKYCKKSGHTIEKCYKLHGYPPNFKFTKGPGSRKTAAHVELKSPGPSANVNSNIGPDSVNLSESDNVSMVPSLTQDQFSQLMMLLQQSYMSLDSFSTPTLMDSANFADSVASDHMTPHKDLLFNLQTLLVPCLVSLPNGYKVKVHLVGSLTLFLNFTIHHVLYVPSFQYNLIFVYKLLEQYNGIVLFTRTLCAIRAPSLKMRLVLGKLDHNLYKLLLSPIQANVKNVNVVDADKTHNSSLFHDFFYPAPSVTSHVSFHPSNSAPYDFAIPLNNYPVSPNPSSSFYESEFPPLRRSYRPHNPPPYLQNYICILPNHSSRSANSTVMSNSSYHHVFEPTTYSQAITIPEWQNAMRKEFEALETNGTWDIVELHKAVKRNWSLFQLDVNNAFLHGDLDDEVFMKLPLGLSVCDVPPDFASTALVCKLKRSLNGLRQASRQWYAKVSQSLSSRGYEHSFNDYSLFTKGSGNALVILVVYVDDIIITRTDLYEIAAGGVLLHHKKFVHDLLKEFHSYDCSSMISSLDMYDKLQADHGDPLPNPETYRCLEVYIVIVIGDLARIVGSPSVVLQFVRGMLRSDFGIVFYSLVSLFCDNQTVIHIAKNHVFHKRTKHIELDCHFVRTQLNEGLLQLLHTSSANQLVDMCKPYTDEEQVKGILKKYDKNRDGKLSKQELRLAFKEMGLHFCRWKAGKPLRFADKNGDGYINEDEISELVQYASKWGFRISWLLSVPGRTGITMPFLQILNSNVWTTEKFKKKSKHGKKARAPKKGGSLHCVGARSMGTTGRLLEKEYGRKMTHDEFFMETHIRKKKASTDPTRRVEDPAETTYWYFPHSRSLEPSPDANTSRCDPLNHADDEASSSEDGGDTIQNTH